MRPILLIMWTAFQSFALRDNNKNLYKHMTNLHSTIMDKNFDEIRRLKDPKTLIFKLTPQSTF